MTSGSEQRQRTAHLMVRLTPDERATLDAAAAQAGLSLAGHARAVLLAAKPLRQARRPPVERAELARLLGAVGKLGSNVNQIARALNAAGNVQAAEFAAARADIAAVRAALMTALGREPGAAEGEGVPSLRQVSGSSPGMIQGAEPLAPVLPVPVPS